MSEKSIWLARVRRSFFAARSPRADDSARFAMSCPPQRVGDHQDRVQCLLRVPFLTELRIYTIIIARTHKTDGRDDLMPGSVRTLRWGSEGRRKRGGARIISFFHGVEAPLFALTAFAKNERADLS